MGKHTANIITGFRILGSILLLFFPVGSPPFYFIYTLCGLSDMADGIVARKSNSISEFGARFDSIADIIFLAAVLIKLLPILHIPKWGWIWITVIVIIRISNMISGLARRKKLLFLHTFLNKITGFLLFLLPLTLHFIESTYNITAVCFIATLAAIQEGYYIGRNCEIV